MERNTNDARRDRPKVAATVHTHLFIHAFVCLFVCSQTFSAQCVQWEGTGSQFQLVLLVASAHVFKGPVVASLKGAKKKNEIENTFLVR